MCKYVPELQKWAPHQDGLQRIADHPGDLQQQRIENMRTFQEIERISETSV